MRIIIEDVPDDLTHRLVSLLQSAQVTVRLEPPWTLGHAAMLLRHLPERVVQIIGVAVEGDGWASAEVTSEDLNHAALGRCVAVDRAMNRCVNRGLLPFGLATPLYAQWDRTNPERTDAAGYTMPLAVLAPFREALQGRSG